MQFLITVSFSVVIPKDLYKNRPLPFLIGSKEWYVKWHIGLAESDTDDAATLSDNDNKNEDLESWTPTHSMSTNMPTSLSESGSVTLQVSSQYRGSTAPTPLLLSKYNIFNFFFNLYPHL